MLPILSYRNFAIRQQASGAVFFSSFGPLFSTVPAGFFDRRDRPQNCTKFFFPRPSEPRSVSDFSRPTASAYRSVTACNTSLDVDPPGYSTTGPKARVATLG